VRIIRPDTETSHGVSAGNDPLVPVSEAIRYRKRAQAAEQKLEEINQKFNALQTKLSEAGQTISSLERRQKMDALLTESDSIDLEAARLLTEHAVTLMDEPDIKLAIEDLKRSKPYLFGRKDKQKSNCRQDILRYLRLRNRGGGGAA